MSFDYDDTTHAIHVTATAKVTHKTGVEMEALTAVSVACLTIYDMTKAISHDIVISDICLVNKTGENLIMSSNNPKNTKKINILYFASLADNAGIDEEIITVTDETLPQVFNNLAQKHGFILTQDKIAVAINHEFSDWNAPVNDGDIVAFIPPVAGVSGDKF